MVFMNSKGKTYHPSIVMVKLNVLHNTNGKVSWIPGNYTARGVILCHKTGKFKMIVLSLTCFIRAGPYLEPFFTALVKVILGLISTYRVHRPIQRVLFHR